MLNAFFDPSVELSSVAVTLIILVFGVIGMILRFKLIQTARPKVRLWCVVGIALAYIPMVLVTYRWACQGAASVQECYIRGFVAILIMCVLGLLMGWVLYYTARNDRDVTEMEKMKLKDL